MRYLGALICGIFFLIVVLTLSHYGLNEDIAFHFLRGQSYLHLLADHQTSFDQPKLGSPVLFVPDQRVSNYKLNAWEAGFAPLKSIINPEGLPTQQAIFKKYIEQVGRQSFYKHNSWNAIYFMDRGGGGHPPVSDVLSALTNRIFYEKLGILGDIEAYHFYAAITALLALVFVFIFSNQIWGKLVASVATLSLGFFPIFFAESHFNIKDIPELSFFAVSIIAFYFWVTSYAKTKRGQSAWFWIFTFAAALAAGTKLNIVFLPFILIPWLISIRKSKAFRGWFSRKLIPYLATFLVLNMVILIGFSPYLWHQTFQKILGILMFYSQVGGTPLKVSDPLPFLGPFRSNFLPIVLILTTTPILTLLFFLLGLFTALLKAAQRLVPARIKNSLISSELHYPNNEHILVLSWLIIPLLRVVWPGADIFGSIRQFMEFLPALAILAGLGASYLLEKLSKLKAIRVKGSYLTVIVMVAFVAYLGWITILFHPNQNVYFNSLVGGPKGAQKLGLLAWQTNYDNPYRQGINWLNKNAEQGAKLAYLDGTMEGVSQLWLRDDIALGSYFSGFDRKGEYSISIVYPNPPQVFPYLYLDRFLTPVHEIKVGGATIAKVWKNDEAHLKDEYKNTVSLKTDWQPTTGSTKLGQYWEIDLGQEYRVLAVRIKVPESDCTKKDGLFYFSDYFLGQRVDLDKQITEWHLPAEKTRTIRYYGLVDNSCFIKGRVTEILSLDN